MKTKQLTTIASIAAVIFIGIGIYYFLTPAGSLLSFMPGYEVGSEHIHTKHGIAAILLALGLFVYVWFATGPKKH